METKICKKCGRELPLEMFDESRHQCKDCRKAYRKRRRQEHPEIHLAQAMRRQKRVQEWLHTLKTPCIICGESEPCCIDFHHINPDTKEFTISQHLGKGRDVLRKEISRCICVCANCHRKIHFGSINLQDYLNNESSSCTTGKSVTE